jgi:hypothetical protein
MSIFERLRKQREDKSNRCLERFLLVRRLEPTFLSVLLGSPALAIFLR